MALRMKALSAAVVLLVLVGTSPAVRAGDTDPAATQIEAFDTALIGVMKEASTLNAKARARRLGPAIEQAFDFPTMIRFAVGRPWATMSEADHAALIDAFRRFTIASYAKNFDGYSGEKFEVDPKVEQRGPDKLVVSHLIRTHDTPVNISYRMRAPSGTWKIIDVYYNGTISQLTTRQSDFASSLASGGAKGLIAHLDAQTEKLLK
jgi:phospholipid transport system substrate-binding protein